MFYDTRDKSRPLPHDPFKAIVAPRPIGWITSFAGGRGEFVWNLATWDLRHAMNETSGAYRHGVNEMEVAGLKAVPSRLVKPPRVADSPCALDANCCAW